MAIETTPPPGSITTGVVGIGNSSSIVGTINGVVGLVGSLGGSTSSSTSSSGSSITTSSGTTGFGVITSHWAVSEVIGFNGFGALSYVIGSPSAKVPGGAQLTELR